jgi:sigma-54 dependent transcriptional regulator, acetoin dehydrogenase operon transcriptional activator AcoR
MSNFEVKKFNRLGLPMAVEVSRHRSVAASSLVRKIGSFPLAGADDLKASWQRCVKRHNLDVTMKARVECLTNQEVREHREPFEDLLRTVDEELDYIWLPLSSVNFSASFSNLAGTIVYYRSDRQTGNHVEDERVGTLWAEGIAGTNGVGTCVVERRPTEVFQKQHFFRDFGTMSCAAAPVLSADSEMTGVLNFCTDNPGLRDDVFAMMANLVRKTAERLNNHLFHCKYDKQTILKARCDAGQILLAVNEDGQVGGANQLARHWLDLAEGPLRAEALGSLFDFDKTAWLDLGKDKAIVLRRHGGELVFEVTRDRAAPSQSRAPQPAASADAGHRHNRKVASGPGTKAHSPAVPVTPTVEDCIGGDPRLSNQLRVLRRVSGSRLPVLVLGETGSGKDTLARALHLEGQRAEKPFVTFNCAAIPETLIDSELFGYGVGAFTGARREGNAGRLVEADGGTLFLDEVGDMPLALQTRLLRVLESGEVSPLGSGKTRVIDVQVIAATNHDLKARVAEGAFRADLYHRLAGVVVNLLPLRDRQDAVELFHATLHRLSETRSIAFSQEALAAMCRHRWPGNVRELKFTLQRALQLCDEGIIMPADLMLDDGKFNYRQDAEPVAPTERRTAQAARSAAERAAIEDALTKHDGNVSQASRTLGISQATFYRKLKQHSLRR